MKLRLLPLAAIAATLLLVAPARAGVVVTVGSAVAGPGTTNNSLDVTLTNTAHEAVEVAAFSFGLSVVNPDITFTSVTTATTLAYILDGNSLFGPVISTTPPPDGQIVVASDLDSTGTGVDIGPLATVGLGHVLFDVAPGAAPGVFLVALGPAPDVTSLSDAFGSNVDITTLNNGQIDIAAVPEPGTLLLLGTCIIGLRFVRGKVAI